MLYLNSKASVFLNRFRIGFIFTTVNYFLNITLRLST